MRNFVTGFHVPERREILLALAFLCCWILPPFWGIATLRTINIQDDIFASDLLNDRLPCRAFVGESLRRGDLPLWMPGVYTGLPSLAAVEIAALYPSNLLLFGVLEPYAAIAYAQLLPLFLAGLGVHLLAREYGVSMAAGLLAAGSFSLSGFFVSHLRQLNMVDAACWIPLLFYFAERTLVRGSRRAPLAAAIVWALQLLAGHPQISYFTGLVLGIYCVARWWQVERPEGRIAGLLRCARDPRVGRFALAIVLGTLLAGAQLLPSIELARSSHRHGGFSFEQASMFAASPRNVWTFFAPYWNGDPGLDTYRLPGLFWEQYGYLGLAPVLLALGALLARRREPVVRLWGGVIVVSYLMVLGRSTPLFYLAYRIVPGMGYFRFPTRFLVFVELGISLASALGLALLLERVRKPALRALVASAALAATFADLWVHQMRQVPQASRSEWTSPIGTVELLRAEKARAGAPWRYYALDSAAVHVATFHEARGWEGDLGPYVRLRAMLQPSFNLLFDLESPDGYVNLAPRYYEAVWGSEKSPGLGVPSGEIRDGALQLKPALATALRLFNVRYVLSAMPVRSARLKGVTRSPEGVEISEVADPLPRAFVVGEARAVRSDDEALRMLESPDFDPERTALVSDAVDIPRDAKASRSVRITSRTNLRLGLHASLENPGLLVVSEGYYPGWRATIDGSETRIIRTNLMMRGVVVPAGEHEVMFEFRPKVIFAGFAVSLFGIAAIALAYGRSASVQPRAQNPLYPGGRQPPS